MLLPAEKAREFQRILREEYGAEVTEGEAGVLAQRLLLLYELIYQRHPNEQPMPPCADQGPQPPPR